MKKILITGINGFFASRFADFYKSKYAVTGLAHQQLDITDASQTLKIIGENKPDYVVHAAAISNTSLCQSDPELSLAVNVKGSVNVAKAAQACNARLIYLSSDQVYAGNANRGPYREDEPLTPNNVYGKHKLQSEDEILSFMPEAIALRITWQFGLPERNKKISSNLIWNTVKALMLNQVSEVPVNDHRGVTYVYELIENIEKMFHIPGGVYNAGSENDLNSYELAETVFKALGAEKRIGELLRKDETRFSDQPRDLRINNQKLKSCGVVFSNSEDSIKSCVKDFSFSNATA